MEKQRHISKYQEINDNVIKEFIDYQQSPNTKKTYLCTFRRILEFTNGASGQSMLDDADAWNRKIVLFQNYLIAQKYSRNYCQMACGVVRAFFAHNHKRLNIDKNDAKRINIKARNSTDYLFTQADLKAMSHGTQTEQYILRVGLSFGLRAEDFCTLTFGDYRLALERASRDKCEAPIFVKELETQKEKGVKARLFLTSDAVEIVKLILDASPTANDKERVFKSRAAQLTKILKILAIKSGVNPHQARIRFQGLRKLTYSALSSVGNEEFAKMIIGKKVSDADAPYLNEADLREQYAKAMPKLLVSNGINGQRLTSVEEALALEKINGAKKDEEIQRLNKKIEQLEHGQKTASTETASNKTLMQELLAEVREQKEQNKRLSERLNRLESGV